MGIVLPQRLFCQPKRSLESFFCLCQRIVTGDEGCLKTAQRIKVLLPLFHMLGRLRELFLNCFEWQQKNPQGPAADWVEVYWKGVCSEVNRLCRDITSGKQHVTSNFPKKLHKEEWGRFFLGELTNPPYPHIIHVPSAEEEAPSDDIPLDLSRFYLLRDACNGLPSPPPWSHHQRPAS